MSKNEQESKVEQSSVVHFLEKVICKTNKQNFPNFPKSPSFTWTQQPVQNHFLTQTTFRMTESHQVSLQNDHTVKSGKSKHQVQAWDYENFKPLIQSKISTFARLSEYSKTICIEKMSFFKKALRLCKRNRCSNMW